MWLTVGIFSVYSSSWSHQLNSAFYPHLVLQQKTGGVPIGMYPYDSGREKSGKKDKICLRCDRSHGSSLWSSGALQRITRHCTSIWTIPSPLHNPHENGNGQGLTLQHRPGPSSLSPSRRMLPSNKWVAAQLGCQGLNEPHQVKHGSCNTCCYSHKVHHLHCNLIAADKASSMIIEDLQLACNCCSRVWYQILWNWKIRFGLITVEIESAEI